MKTTQSSLINGKTHLNSGMITWQDYKRLSYREILAGRCAIDKDFDSSFPQMLHLGCVPVTAFSYSSESKVANTLPKASKE